MGWGSRLAGRFILGSARAGSRIGNHAGQSTSSRIALHRAGRGARRGYLAPGDPTPPPTAPGGWLDYRGTATWREARNLAAPGFPLGMFTDLARGVHHGPIAVPGHVMNQHAVVVGPAGSGKTHGIIVPWIYAALRAEWSVVAVDVKGDLRDDLLRYKAAQGGAPLGNRVSTWDFLDPARSASWNWIAELHDVPRIDAAVTAIIGRPNPNANVDPHFHRQDYRILKGLLLFVRAVLPQVSTASELLRLLEDDAALDQLVRAHPAAPGAPDLAALLRHAQADHPRLISGVVTALSVFDTPAVGTVTKPSPHRPAIDLGSALDDHHLLILGAALRGGEVSKRLSSLMLNQISQRLYERFSGAPRPVLLVVDEAQRVADRVDLAELMEVARSAGVGVVAAFQDVARIKDPGERSSILSNAATLVVLPGSSPLSAEAFGQRLGKRTAQTHGLSVGGRHGGFGRPLPTRSYGTESVAVLGAREVMDPPGTRAAVVHVKATAHGATAKPFVVELER